MVEREERRRPAEERTFDAVYREVKRLAGRALERERDGHAFQTTALAHEALVRLGGGEDLPEERVHRLALVARAIQHVLVDSARQRRADKRGGGAEPILLELEPAAGEVGAAVDVIDLHQALLELGQLDPRQARVVELRFFGGLSIPETALVLGVAPRTVNDDWAMARAWLHKRLDSERGP
jgi:RNA polymerase sigma factor (TIGR02999 family)